MGAGDISVSIVFCKSLDRSVVHFFFLLHLLLFATNRLMCVRAGPALRVCGGAREVRGPHKREEAVGRSYHLGLTCRSNGTRAATSVLMRIRKILQVPLVQSQRCKEQLRMASHVKLVLNGVDAAGAVRIRP